MISELVTSGLSSNDGLQTSDLKSTRFFSTLTSSIVTTVYHNERTLNMCTNMGSILNKYHDWGSQTKSLPEAGHFDDGAVHIQSRVQYIHAQ